MNIISHDNGQRVIVEVKKNRMTRIHTPFNFHVRGHRIGHCSNENIDEHAWYPDMNIDREKELDFNHER